MLSFEPELVALRDDGAVAPAEAERLLAVERGTVFAVHWELRIAAWAGVALLTTGVGLWLRDHYDEIGPAAVVALIGALSLCCYLFALRGRLRGDGWTSSPVSEYVLLLGALLLSADLGFAETQYHMLDGEWSRHLLILAVVHGITAYVFGSRLVLSLSIASLAAWLGVRQNAETFFQSTAETGTQAMVCALLLLAWRAIHLRVTADGRSSSESGDERFGFGPVFDHFIANLSLWGALLWSFDDSLEWPGLLFLAIFAGLSIRYGLRGSRQIFIHYGVVYGYIGLSRLVFELSEAVGNDSDTRATIVLLWFILTVPALVTAVIVIHRRAGREL